MANSPSEEPEYDLAVIGAGPAGVAGAVTAAELGLAVALLDAAERPGGQFYRHPHPALGAARPRPCTTTGAPSSTCAAGWPPADCGTSPDTTSGRSSPRARRAPGRARRHRGGRRRALVRIRARAVLLATGAYERQLPSPAGRCPGWWAPGSAGDAEVRPGAARERDLLRRREVAGRSKVVVAGSGPLLLAVATTLAAAGPVSRRWSRRPTTSATPADPAPSPPSRASWRRRRHRAALWRHGVRLRTRSAVTEVHGADRVAAVTVSRLDRDWRPVRGPAAGSPATPWRSGTAWCPSSTSPSPWAAPPGAPGRGVGPRPGHAPADLRPRRLGRRRDGRRRRRATGMWKGVGGPRDRRSAARTPAPTAIRRARSLRRRRDRMRAFADVMARTHAPAPAGAGGSTTRRRSAGARR
ncbi:FAD-dependent oxidoreductase [Streptomyces noursei]|nr:FAD-dependent oxidoreductase [Streptomyces noursei]